MQEMLEAAILEGDELESKRLTQELLDLEMPPRQILDSVLLPAIRKAGDLWEDGEIFIPELMQAGNALKIGIDILKPLLDPAKDSSNQATIVIGTIQGDIHDIGKTLVAGMLQAAGHRVIDLGADISPARFVEEAVDHDANLICVSALLTTTMLNQKEVVIERDKSSLKGRAMVMVGGAPVSRSWAERIGADGYAPDAFRAVDEASRLLALQK